MMCSLPKVCGRAMLRILCALVLAVPVPAQEASGGEQIEEAFLGATLRHLASDAMNGRNTPSPELDAAATWIAERLAEWKLEPAYADGYLDGPRLPDRERSQAKLALSSSSQPYDGAAILATTTVAPQVGLPVVGWTFGEDAGQLPERSLVEGKALLVWDPPFGPEDPARRELSWRRLTRRLEERNIAALILVGKLAPPETSRAAFPILFGNPVTRPEGVGPRGLIPGATLDLSIPVGRSRFASNVVAMRRGSDPTLVDQVIVFSAHYDHVGRGRPVNGDDIYNGADDNATGTSAVLALAKAFSAAKVAPKRTVMFVLFYGEERGFLGSNHFCAHPPVPLDRIKAVFNIEMVGRPDDIEPKSAWITGWGESDFGAIVAGTVAPTGFRFYERPGLSARLFSASDNLPFARRGIPAHSLSAGSLHRDYHQPSDSVEKIDIPNMAAVVRAIFRAGHVMADGGRVPTWAQSSSYRPREPR